MICLIAAIYLCINCWYTLTVKPVYPVMTWTGVMGFVVPLGVAALALGIFFGLEYLSKRRLRKHGWTKVVDILNG